MICLSKGFDAYGLDRRSKEDQKGILESSKYRKYNFLFNNFFNFLFFIVNDLIEEEINTGIPPERVVRKRKFHLFFIYFLF